MRGTSLEEMPRITLMSSPPTENADRGAIGSPTRGILFNPEGWANTGERYIQGDNMVCDKLDIKVQSSHIVTLAASLQRAHTDSRVKSTSCDICTTFTPLSSSMSVC